LIKKQLNLPGDYPFRLGSTSYVYPGDILFNVERLAPVFDDIELVLFESSDTCNFPDLSTIKKLKKLAQSHDCTYTVHLPIDKKAGVAGKKERSAFFNQVIEIVDLTFDLKPFGYILHLEGITRDASEKEVAQWQKNADETCGKIASIQGIDPKTICIENLDYPCKWNDFAIEKYGFSYCVDIGHLFLYKENWKSILNDYFKKTRVMHLHGVRNMKDHISLKENNLRQTERFVDFIKDKFTGVLTLEVFNEKDAFESRELIGDIWEK
jgi:sugar phosphate isomerase/epimerase